MFITEQKNLNFVIKVLLTTFVSTASDRHTVTNVE